MELTERRGAETFPTITLIGSRDPRGSYLLRIQVQQDLEVAFGRFDHGRPVLLRRGAYVYLGSAMGQRGASSLPHRLLRHTIRTQGRRPQAIHGQLLASFQGAGLVDPAMKPARTKTLFWHIDYLLDNEEAEISHLVALCSPDRLEAQLADLLIEDPGTAIVATGLGARDRPGSTHLLRVDGGEAWWCQLVDRVERSIL